MKYFNQLILTWVSSAAIFTSLSDLRAAVVNHVQVHSEYFDCFSTILLDENGDGRSEIIAPDKEGSE